MKFIHLAYKNIGGQSKNIDFANKIAGCITVSDIEGQPLADALSLALYGAQNNCYRGITFPAQVALKFSIKDVSYTIIRLFNLEEGTPVEQAVLTDLDETQVIAEGVGTVNEYLAGKFLITKSAFDMMFLADRASVAQELTQDAASREKFIANVVNAVTTSDEIISKTNILKASEKELNDYIDSIPPVTRKAVKEQQTIVAADKVEVDSLRNDIAATHAAIAKARQYEEDMARLNLEASNLEKLKDKKAAVDNNALFIARSREATAIKDIFTEYEAEYKKIQGVKADFDAKKAERDALEAKIKEGEQSAKTLEQKFIYHNEKTAELDRQLKELLDQAAKNPDAIKIDGLVDFYYSSTAKQIQDLEAKQKSLNTEYQVLKDACLELETRKNDLQNTCEYKKTVEDGAVIEAKISRINNEISSLETVIRKHEKEQIELYEQNITQIDRIRDLQAKYREIDAVIRQDKGSHKEAQDAVILYAQSIYAKHIIASGYEAEIKAVIQKIDKLTSTNDTFKNKRDVIIQRKKELELHIEKLEAKQKMLNDKLTEYIGFNRLKDYSDAIEYGSHCPICDGFVTLKKDLPLKDTGLIQEQIDIVSAEIEKDRQGITEAANFISQYDSNLAISTQYVAALEETKKQKENAINIILADFGASSLKDLYAKTHIAAQESTQFIRNLNDFHEIDAELRRLQENNAHVVNAYNKMAQEILPAEREKYAALNKELIEIVGKYEAMQSVLNGENAEDLLVKLQIVEREREVVETELAQKQIKLAEVAQQRQENLDKLAAIQNKVLPIQHKGSRYNYKQVIIKSVAETLNKILEEKDQNEEQKEIAKTRLAGVRKLLDKYRAQLISLDKELSGLNAKIESFNEASNGIYKHYRERFGVLGVTTSQDLAALVLSADELARREKEVQEYREELAKSQNTVDEIAARINANEAYFAELDQNKATLEELEAILQSAVVKYTGSEGKLQAMSAAYNDLVASNRKLSALQEKLRALEELSSAICNCGVNAKDFAKIVVERASKKVQRWTSDRYTFQLSIDGKISLYNNLKGKAVSPSKYNKEERMLVNTGLPFAFGSALSDLIVFDLPQATVLTADETEKSGLGVLLEVAKEKDLIVIPENSELLYKTISKLA